MDRTKHVNTCNEKSNSIGLLTRMQPEAIASIKRKGQNLTHRDFETGTVPYV